MAEASIVRQEFVVESFRLVITEEIVLGAEEVVARSGDRREPALCGFGKARSRAISLQGWQPAPPPNGMGRSGLGFRSAMKQKKAGMPMSLVTSHTPVAIPACSN